ncbi:nucleotidyl transferase AbiEii/AbiGii toxin family protein [Nocardiopsis potens]|uniref:nucleotidyl transferase AbiEii/AbiGii toxin family protein n=1 Tax=Nocardiopsis potens TaxID=1246458 RepID=UPI000475EE33|nr:nucleotidyl transferase AbiEii/AbiGii toxin family protein [Nocardiopsis potens]
MEFAGDFETHLTLDAAGPERVEEAARWAAENGLKFTHIELDAGEAPSQPMVTYHGYGTLGGELATAREWAERLAGAGLPVLRTKIEAAPVNDGVPADRAAAEALPEWCYFEHHIKLLLPGDADLAAIAALVEPHSARLSRNARKVREDGAQERFVTQRCSRVGRPHAADMLGRLREALIEHGLPWVFSGRPGFGIVSMEREFVVYDSALSLDAGWMDAAPVQAGPDAPARSRSAYSGFPASHLPVTGGPHARQQKVFDPALKHFSHAYRPGEPVFADQELGERWWAAQRRAMEHVLTAVAAGPWADRLMLRGSMVMPLWAGERARRPRDLDWVVLGGEDPEAGAEADAYGAEGSRLLEEVVAAIGGTDPGPGLSFDTGAARFDGIWTYDRVPGRRVVVPWRGGEGLPPGTVQLDVVFGEELPLPPVRAAIPVDGGARTVRLPAAGADLSLAWKVQWLFTDMYPQGKDLYDAVLLGERTRVPRSVLVDLLRPELGEEADRVDERYLRAQDYMDEEEWGHFTRDCPWVRGSFDEWLSRFERALAPSFASG